MAVTYTAIPVTYGETGLTFTVQPDNTITDISVAYGAGGYGPDTVNLTIPGTTFPGGTSPANDIIFTVQTFEYPGPVYVTQTNSAVIYADGTPPSRYDTVYSLGDVGIGAGNQHWVFGTDGKLTTPGNIVILSTESSISATTGALRVAGGAGVAGNLNVAGTATFGIIGGIVNVVSTAVSTSSTTGALRVAGGVGIGGDLNVAGTITANQLTIQYTTITTTIVETDDIIKTFNTTSSTGTTSGALVIAGGGGFGGDVYANAFFANTTSYVANAEIITTSTLANSLRTITYLANYITLDPTLVAVSGTSTVYGNYQSGNLASISTYGDYDNAGGYFEVWDAASAPAFVVYVGFTNVPEFNRLALNINYTVQSGHTIEIDLYNYQTSTWDAFGQYTGLNGYFTFALGVISSVPYISSGTVTLRLYHINFGNTSLPHKTKIDYVALEKSIQGGQGPRGFIGYTGSQGLTTTTSSAFVFTNTTTSTSTETGAVVIKGGLGVAKDVFIGGDVHVLSTTNSTATTNGAVSILGGIGIVKDLWVGGIIYSAGQAVVTTSTVDAALNQTLQSITDKGFTTTNRINITNETNSTSTDTGALTVFGGVGIGHDLWVGGRIMSDNSQVITVTTVDQFAATEIRAGTDTAVSTATGSITIWNTSTLQSITNRGSSTTNAIQILNTLSNTSTVTANALFVNGGVGINGTLLVQGKAVFRDDVLFIGSSTSIFSTNTYYTDNLIELHTPPGGPSVPWTLSDGRDIGFRFHYYDVFTGDQNAALVLDPYTKNLEWYSTGAEDAAGNFSSATYGTFKTGEIVIANSTPTFGTNSGALRVVGGVGIGGDLYVGGNIIGLATTASTFFGTAVAATNIAGGKPNLIPYQGTTSTTNFDDNLRWLPETSTLAIGTTSSGSITVTQNVRIGNVLTVNRIGAIDTSSLYFNANGIYNTGTSTSTHYWSFNNDGTTSFPGYKFPAGDGPYGYALVTNGTGTVNWSPVLSYVGSVGFTGSSSGFTGSTGYWGSIGQPGYTGSIGYAGSMGVGYTGSSSGYIGSTGYAGSIGYTGSIGIGYTGSTSGYIGSTGYTGSQGFGYTGSGGAGYTGSMGYSGSQGPRGADGTSVRILGSVSTASALPGYPSSYTGQIGDGYITLDTGHLWVWNGSTWIDAGNITGPQGTIGYSGSKGAGFTGSVGTLGYTGSIGYQGSKGALDPWVKIVANYTAVNNQRLIADTSAGQFTVALPDNPFIGSYLVITDGANWKDIPLLITAGASTIEGYGDTLVLDIAGITSEFIWSGSTWQVTATLGIRGAAGYTGSYGGFAAVGYTGSQADLSAISTNILPVTSGTYALGAVDKGWTSVYANFAYIGSNSYVGNETADSLTVNKTLVINTNTIYLGGNTLNINAQGTLLLNGGQVGISAVQATALAAAMSVVMGM